MLHGRVLRRLAPPVPECPESCCSCSDVLLACVGAGMHDFLRHRGIVAAHSPPKVFPVHEYPGILFGRVLHAVSRNGPLTGDGVPVARQTLRDLFRALCLAVKEVSLVVAALGLVTRMEGVYRFAEHADAKDDAVLVINGYIPTGHVDTMKMTRLSTVLIRMRMKSETGTITSRGSTQIHYPRGGPRQDHRRLVADGGVFHDRDLRKHRIEGGAWITAIIIVTDHTHAWAVELGRVHLVRDIVEHL